MLDQKDMTPPPDSAEPALRDDEGALRADYVERVSEAIERNDAAALRALAGDLHESDTGDLIEALDPELRPRFVELLGREFDFTALTEVEDAVREEILEELPPKTVAEGVRDLDSDDAAYILEDLPKEEQAEILEQLPRLERVALERILEYPENSAGRRMQTEFIAVPPSWTVGQAIDYMRETVDLPDRFYELYVIDGASKLLGAVALDLLLRNKRPVPLSELMDPERRRVRATEDQEEVARMFERYNLVAAPVVDDGDKLVGVLTFDDIVDVIEEEAEEDIKALGGVGRSEELSDSVWTIVQGPLPLAARQSRHRAARVLGDPAVRGLDREDGRARGADADRRQHGRQRRHADHDRRGARARHPRPRRRQRRRAWCAASCWSGILNGLGFAVIMGAIAAAWFGIADLGLVIGLAMICVLAAAALGGIAIPLLLIAARRRPGDRVRPVRHHRHRRGRLFRLSRHRHAVVRPEMMTGR